MIVEEPPYHLVAVFADLDAKLFLEEVIERAQVARLLAPFRWRSLRDARRDAFRADPVAALGPLVQNGERKFLFTWDHHGSGREVGNPAASERDVERTLIASGVPEQNVLAVAFVPEIEAVLVPVWPRVVEIVARIRGGAPISAEFILATATKRANKSRITLPETFDEALASHPKEVFQGLVTAMNLRRSANIYQRLGQQLSIPGLRVHPEMARLLGTLEAWFPGRGWNP